MRKAATVVLMAAALAGGAPAASALSPVTPRPPREARILPGVGMAGVTVGQVARGPVNGRLTSKPFDTWGRLENDFCFEGSACLWAVSGSATVSVDRGQVTGRVNSIGTTARGWTTANGAGPGVTVAALKRRFRRVTRIRTCDIGGFGAELVGYRLGLHTLFQVQGATVTAVYVARQTLRNRGASCG